MSWCSNRTALHCTWTFCIWTFYAWKFCAWTFCVRKFTKPLSPTPSQEKIEIIFESCLFKVDEFGFFIYWKPANRVSSSIFFHYSLSVLSAGLALLVLPRTVLLELPRSAPISPIHQCIKFFPELLSVRSVLSVWSVRSFWEILSIWTVLSVQSVLQSCIGSVPSEDLLHFDGACNRFFSNHIQCLQETFLTMRTRTFFLVHPIGVRCKTFSLALWHAHQPETSVEPMELLDETSQVENLSAASQWN